MLILINYFGQHFKLQNGILSIAFSIGIGISNENGELLVIPEQYFIETHKEYTGLAAAIGF